MNRIELDKRRRNTTFYHSSSFQEEILNENELMCFRCGASGHRQKDCLANLQQNHSQVPSRLGRSSSNTPGSEQPTAAATSDSPQFQTLQQSSKDLASERQQSKTTFDDFGEDFNGLGQQMNASNVGFGNYGSRYGMYNQTLEGMESTRVSNSGLNSMNLPNVNFDMDANFGGGMMLGSKYPNGQPSYPYGYDYMISGPSAISDPFEKDDGNMRCYNCDEVGHMSRNCSRARSCFLCGEPTHIAKQCRFIKDPEIQQLKQTMNANAPMQFGHQNQHFESNFDMMGMGGMNLQNMNMMQKTGNQMVCLNCNEPGHRLKNCPHQKKCFLCSQTGHVARECPMAIAIKKKVTAANIAKYGSANPTPSPSLYFMNTMQYQQQFAAFPNVGMNPLLVQRQMQPMYVNVGNVGPVGGYGYSGAAAQAQAPQQSYQANAGAGYGNVMQMNINLNQHHNMNINNLPSYNTASSEESGKQSSPVNLSSNQNATNMQNTRRTSVLENLDNENSVSPKTEQRKPFNLSPNRKDTAKRHSVMVFSPTNNTAVTDDNAPQRYRNNSLTMARMTPRSDSRVVEPKAEADKAGYGFEFATFLNPDAADYKPNPQRRMSKVKFEDPSDDDFNVVTQLVQSLDLH